MHKLRENDLTNVLIAYDDFISENLFKECIRNSLKNLNLSLSFYSYKVKMANSSKNIPSYLGELTFGDPRDLLKRIKGVEILLVHKAPVTSEVIKSADKLRIIGVPRTFPDNVDIKTATEKGIPIVYAPGRNARAVAELTIGLILTEVRNICRAQSWFREGNWKKSDSDDYPKQFFTGIELEDKSLGIVGFGEIGKRVAKIASELFGEIMVYDPYVRKDEMSKYNVKYVDFKELLSKSDVITLHVRLPKDSDYLIGKNEIAQMKRTAYIINTSDGPVIDPKALVDALRSKRIAGAAQDCWTNQPRTPDNPLLQLNNITVTPGIGGASKEVPKRGVIMVAEDIARFYKNEKPFHIVNPETLESPKNKRE
jgi:phosphoglycerate dehydrogenase-like enzyme